MRVALILLIAVTLSGCGALGGAVACMADKQAHTDDMNCCGLKPNCQR